MKNNQQGFVGAIIAVIIGLVFFAAGWYLVRLVVDDVQYRTTSEPDKQKLARSMNIKSCVEAGGKIKGVDIPQYCACVVDDYYTDHGNYGDEDIDLSDDKATTDLLYPYIKKCLSEQGIEV